MPRRLIDVGWIVQARAPLSERNGSKVVAAIVTRVWGEVSIGGHRAWMTNLHAIHDGHECVWRSSVYVFETEAAAMSLPGWNAWLIPRSDYEPA